jgi:hypothetical protein
MKLRFNTSIPGCIEGLVIDVERLTPDLKRFLEIGVVSVVRGAGDDSAEPEAEDERAVMPGGRRRRGRTDGRPAALAE